MHLFELIPFQQKHLYQSVQLFWWNGSSSNSFPVFHLPIFSGQCPFIWPYSSGFRIEIVVIPFTYFYRQPRAHHGSCFIIKVASYQQTNSIINITLHIICKPGIYILGKAVFIWKQDSDLYLSHCYTVSNVLFSWTYFNTLRLGQSDPHFADRHYF